MNDHIISMTPNATHLRRGRNDPLLEPVIEMLQLTALKLPKNRVRKESKKQIAKVRRAIAEFGYCQPILIAGDNEIIDGATRAAALLELGLAVAPCIRADGYSENERRLLRVVINKTQETGIWDLMALKLEFAYLLEFETDLTITGFEAAEIDHVLEIGAGGDADDDFDMPKSDASAVSVDGDMWQLGDHRILCGNARSPVDFGRLLAGDTAALVFTDPPYDVPIRGHVSSSHRHQEFAEASGEMTSAEFERFLAITLGNAAAYLKRGGLLYAFMDWRHMDDISAALRRIGLELVQLCVWAKDYPGMGSFYRSQHELVFIARVPGATHRNNIELGKNGRNRSNLWSFAGATGGRTDDADDFSVHPTVKPVQLIAEAILDVTAVGEVILDPFLGSGSTLLAAERTKRRCFGLEISPTYVDVAIRRWQKMTGSAAVHAETGKTFDVYAAEQQAANSDAGPDAGEDF